MSPESLKAQFFVTRASGNWVPLIAMDELPPTITIRNVPRLLDPFDVAGMTCVGTYESRHLQHTVDLPVSNSNSLLVDRSLMASKYAGSDHHLTRPVTYQGPEKAYGIQEQPPSSPSPHHLATSNHAIPTAAVTPDRTDRNGGPRDQQPLPAWHDPSVLPKPLQNAPGVKQYCSYWLRHGECDYAQQGCLYKHEMPLKPEILHRLGLRDIPRWYRERHGLGSYLAVSGGSGVAGEEMMPNIKLEKMHGNWRDSPGSRMDQSSAEAVRAAFSRIGVRDSNSKPAAFDETGNPACPPSTPQMVAKQISNTNTRSRFGDVSATAAKRPTQILKNSNIARTTPTETMQQRQNRETIETLDRIETGQRRRKEAALGKDGKIIALGIEGTSPATRPSTSSSESSHSTAAATPVDMGTPATSTEESEAETIDLLSPIESAKTSSKKTTVLGSTSKPHAPKLRPVTTGQLVKAPKPNSTANGRPNRGKKSMSKKPTRARKMAQDSDQSSAGSGRKGSLVEVADGEEKGEYKGYDHDD